MTSTDQLLKNLEERDLLPSKLIEKLRKQIAQSSKPVSARAVAKRLVKMGHLTSSQADRLLEAADETAVPTKKKPRPKPAESGFDLAPIDEEKGVLEEEDLEDWERELDEAAVARPVDEPPPPPRPIEEPAAAAEPAPPPGPLQGPLADTALADVALAKNAAATEGERRSTAAPKRNVKNLFGFLGRRRKIGRKENEWDSPLLLVGGGALLLIVILGAGLWWSLLSKSGDDMLEQAHEFYRDGAYTKAIDQYNQFLDKHPGHNGASLAHVRRGLAQLRQAAEGTSNWPRALGVAKKVLDEIGTETEFKEARPELASLLPDIAVGMAAHARKTPSPELVAETREALALVDKYVPKSMRPITKLGNVNNSLAITEREIACSGELGKAVTAMREAVESGKTQDAYGIRAALLKQYPNLVDNEELVKAVLEVSQAEQKDVKVETRRRAATTEETPDSMAAAVAVARRATRQEAPGARNYVIFAQAGGAVYGLDAATGKVLWRRSVGFNANGRSLAFPPTAISDRPGSDALLVGASAHELLRVEGATGRLRWRHELGERFDAHPVVVDDRILVATRSGRLVSIDLNSGDSPSYIQLSQQLRVAPTVDVKRSRIYQVAEHSNLYVLSLTDGSCQEVVYLGHPPGTITTAPVIISNYLVVADNRSVRGATLRVFSLDSKEDAPAVRPLHEIDLEGHVDTPPVVSGARMLVATDVGKVYAFQISGTDVERPLEGIAHLQTGDEKDLIRFIMLKSNQFWIADSQLTKFDIQSSLGSLRQKWSVGKDSGFLQPLVAIGRTIFHVRRRLHLPGVVVSAVGMGRPDVFWETHLAARLAMEPIVDEQSGRITAVTTMGSVIELPVADLKGHRIVDQSVVALKTDEIRKPMIDAIRTRDGLLALLTGSGAEKIAVFDPRQTPRRFRWVVLPDVAGCRPIIVAGGLLVPCQLGQVFLLDPRTGGKLLVGGKMVEPFQPKLETDSRLQWRRPALVGEKEVVLADNLGRLYLLGIKDQPKPHVAVLAQTDLARPISSPLAAVGKVVYAVDESGTLLVFDLPKLTQDQEKRLAIGGAAVWGPRRVGRHVFLTTDSEQLLCLDDHGKLVWKIDLPHGPLAGSPLAVGDHYILASTRGVVWRVGAADGKELGKIETGRPLGTGPVPLGNGLLLSGHDGTLYRVEKP
jgi:outer membrane protein assembly factor BamB/TolA-binding protein